MSKVGEGKQGGFREGRSTLGGTLKETLPEKRMAPDGGPAAQEGANMAKCGWVLAS